MSIINKVLASNLIFSVVMIIAALLLGISIYSLVIILLKRLPKLKFANSVVHINAALFSLIPAACMMSILPILRFKEGARYAIAHSVSIWIIASAGWLLIGGFKIAREKILAHYNVKAKNNLAARRVHTQINVIDSIVVIVIILVTVSVILMTFDRVRQIGASILASAGIIGVVLGFAAQKTLGNLIAGIQIAFAQPIRLDDAVVVEGEWGWIEEITLTYVVVRIWDLRRLIVPISYFIEKHFQNWTRMSADLIGSVFLYADYTVPIDKIREELTRILNNSLYWDKKVNVLQVTNIAEATVELRALMSAADSPTTWNLRCEVREKLLLFMQKNFSNSLPKTRIELNKS